MIRRDNGNDWLLIAQVEHARLAADVARVWGNNLVPELRLPEQLVAAICEHDDGWHGWEQSPGVDPHTGRPRDFTEMPMRVATRLWSESIRQCRRLGALQGIWVSRHFCSLAVNARKSRRDCAADISAIREFVTNQWNLRATWRNECEQTTNRSERDELIRYGLLMLQFFDRVSLWVCCADRQESWEVRSPHVGTVTFSPLENDRFRVEPFPLSVDSLELSADARRIPARRYTDDADLQQTIAAAPLERLSWTLCP